VTTQHFNRQIIIGYLCAIGATALWSGNFIIARGLSESISPITLAFWRWVVAVAVFVPLAWESLIAEWDILTKNLPYLLLTSVLGITVFNTLLYYAGHSTTAINLSLISITFPVFIVIFSRIFFREAITLRRGAGIIVVAFGVVFLITKGSLSTLLHLSFAIGDLWMLTAAIIFAVYSILLKNKPPGLSIWALHLSTFMLGLLFLFPLFVWDCVTGPAVAYDPNIIGSILYVGVFASLTAFVLWSKAIVAVGPVRAGMIYYTLPLFSGFTAYLVLKEPIGIVHFFSLFLIVSGILIANSASTKVSHRAWQGTDNQGGPETPVKQGEDNDTM